MFSESLYAGMGWISPKYVEDDHDTLADSYLVTLAIYC